MEHKITKSYIEPNELQGLLPMLSKSHLEVQDLPVIKQLISYDCHENHFILTTHAGQNKYRLTATISCTKDELPSKLTGLRLFNGMEKSIECGWVNDDFAKDTCTYLLTY